MKPVDIMQECTALFTQEDTLAYFDLKFSGAGFIEGLCRIAHPRKSSGGTEYVSLVFIIDTPGEADREHAIAGLKQLGSGRLEKVLPEISAAVSVPPPVTSRQIYIKQFDLMLKDKFTASPEFIERRLYPALNSILDTSSGELGWWENIKKEKPSAPAAAPITSSKSFISRLQEKLFG